MVRHNLRKIMSSRLLAALMQETTEAAWVSLCGLKYTNVLILVDSQSTPSRLSTKFLRVDVLAPTWCHTKQRYTVQKGVST